MSITHIRFSRRYGRATAGAAVTVALGGLLAACVMQLPDGSYVVHVLRKSGGEVRVRLSKSFSVTGVEQGPPDAGGAPSASDATTARQ